VRLGLPLATFALLAAAWPAVGLSFMGPKWGDQQVLDLGAAYERAHTVVLKAPSFKRWGE